MHHLHSPLQTKEKGNHCNIKEAIIYHKKKSKQHTTWKEPQIKRVKPN
jgi:hypothetical protein